MSVLHGDISFFLRKERSGSAQDGVLAASAAVWPPPGLWLLCSQAAWVAWPSSSICFSGIDFIYVLVGPPPHGPYRSSKLGSLSVLSCSVSWVVHSQSSYRSRSCRGSEVAQWERRLPPSLTTWVQILGPLGSRREATPTSCPVTGVYILPCTCTHKFLKSREFSLSLLEKYENILSKTTILLFLETLSYYTNMGRDVQKCILCF